MRYLIVLLVVLSFVASFGIVELESAKIVGADRFSYTIGAGWNIFASIYGGTDISLHAGFEYGLSEYLSVCLKGDFLYRSYFYSDSSLLGYDLACSLKTSFDIADSPFSLGFSLGGELQDEPMYNYYYYGYSDGEGVDLNKTQFAGRGSVIFQAWFVYLGLKLNTHFDGYNPNPTVVLGFDIEYNENLSMLVELGSSTGYYYPQFLPKIAIGIETTF